MKRPESFKTKLWLYFVLFTAIIFSVLWLLQTVFLQTFYNHMLIGNTKAAAREIIGNADNENLPDIIDEVTHDNSLLIYITDTYGNPVYVSDEYKKSSKTKRLEKEGPDDARKVFLPEKHSDTYRSLPEDYSELLEQVKASENGVTEYQDDNSYVYAAYIHSSRGTGVIYVSTLLNAVGSAVEIIRIQLIIVTVFSLLAGFVLAWLIARLFSKPVLQLSQKAGVLGEDAYSSDFKKGFCRELDDLNDTLDRTSEKLRKSRTFQNELLANVSHDLRTPLTMIKGYAEEVGEYSWQDEQQRKADIAVIIRETDRLTALVNEILAYSELQAQEGTGDFRKVDFSQLVRRVSENFNSLYRREGYDIRSEIEDGVTVSGNASQLERVVINLLDNAIRHTGESKKADVSLHREGQRAVLRIADYGPGIAASELENIWERYYTSRQRNHQGTSGLGLAIVKQIVTLHNGTCTVCSEEGQGSTFVIELMSEAPGC